jgi:hypothetical protein
MELWLMFSVVVCLLAYLAWRDHSERQDRRELLNRILARNPAELRALDAKIAPREPTPVDEELRDFFLNGDPVGL